MKGKPNPIEPTEAQIKNCFGLGWEYIGGWLFARGDMLGWFSKDGFYKE